jgi:charged multivesicular body protein 4
MKRKKLLEAEMDKIQNVKMTLETQVINLESAAQNAETFQAMNAGKSAMKKIRDDVGIDQVDGLMEDIREEMEMANEISDAIAQPVDPLAADDDELLAELEQMGADDLEAELLKAPAAKNEVLLPSVPNSKLPNLNAAEAEEMKKLEAELAGL